MDKYDERQEQVRGRIMTRAFILTILLLMGIAFVNIQKNIGFGETLLCIVCIDITYVSVASIWNGSYFAPMMDGRMRLLAYLFTGLAVILTVLSIYDAICGEPLQLLNIISLFMILSITICLWIRRADWKK